MHHIATSGEMLKRYEHSGRIPRAQHLHIKTVKELRFTRSGASNNTIVSRASITLESVCDTFDYV